MKKIKVLSLFDGISCAQQALKELGFKVDYYASEIDKYAIFLTQKNHPLTYQMGDVKNIGHHAWYPANGIDLLIGGSPCQDLSIAKKNREGLDGKRSGLFWEYVRILKELKPKYFVLENVNSMPKEAKEIITKTLGVEPIMINAALVSAQNRKRLFWTNIPNITLPEDKNILLRDILEPKVDECYTVKPKSNTVRTSGRGSEIDDKHNWDTIRIGTINKGGQGDRIYSKDGKSVALSANGGGRGAKTGLYLVSKNLNKMVSYQHGKDSKLDDRTLESQTELRNEEKQVFGVQTKKENRDTSSKRELARQSERKSSGDLSELSYKKSQKETKMQSTKLRSDTPQKRILREAQSALQKMGQSSSGESESQTSVIRRLTCVECERLQSLPDGYTGGVSNAQRYKCLGNAFNKEVVKHILKNIK
jgi:DNA (cytosine-5)-methyltransferase 3A